MSGGRHTIRPIAQLASDRDQTWAPPPHQSRDPGRLRGAGGHAGAPAGASGSRRRPDINKIGQIGDVGSPDSLSVPLEMLLFIGIPLLGFIIAGLLAFRPQRGASRRYRPGRPWAFEPVWFGDESALEHEPKRAALPGAGGASGRW